MRPVSATVVAVVVVPPVVVGAVGEVVTVYTYATEPEVAVHVAVAVELVTPVTVIPVTESQ